MKKSAIFDLPYEGPQIQVLEFCPGQAIAEASYNTGDNPDGVDIDDEDFIW